MSRECLVCHESKIPEDYVAATAIVCAKCMLSWRPKRLIRKRAKYGYRTPGKEYYALQRFLRKWADKLEVG